MRPYTGTDKIATGKRAGTEALVAAIQNASGRQVWNNGTFGVRKKRGAQSSNLSGMSVHSTGRAADLSRRAWSGRPGCSRADLEKVIDWLVSVAADDIGLEYLADYEYGSGGRGWRCDRDDWNVYKPGVIKGGGSGDWIHIEIDNDHADTTDWVDAAMSSFPLGSHVPAQDTVTGWKTCRLGDRGDNVKAVQTALSAAGYKNSSGRKPIVIDGDFGANTDKRVRQYQKDNGLVVDGIVGPQTAGHMNIA
jgi:murein L,D-transpeptidase YcbB/YkuD